MYCWRFVGRVYHITADGDRTICGQSLTGRQRLKWCVSDLDRPPMKRPLCLSCKRARGPRSPSASE